MKCPHCGTNGDHYCPNDVDTHDTDPNVCAKCGRDIQNHAEWCETRKQHTKDSDCTVDIRTGTCVVCGVGHDDPCPECNQRAFHLDTCSLIEEVLP